MSARKFTDTHQWCNSCEHTLSHSSFAKNKLRASGLQLYCKECNAKYRKAGGSREGNLKANYGLTLQDYENLLESQNGKCAICGSTNPGKVDAAHLAVDHCHETGKVRGLLCNSCNNGLGRFKDDPVILTNAVTYLENQE